MKPFMNIAAHLGNVVFNFRGRAAGDLSAFALGYQRAAQQLVGRFRSQAVPDYDGYPVLFLYRHALELYLKSVVYEGAALMRLVAQPLSEDSALFRKHGLVRLLPAVHAIFNAMQWNFKATPVGTFEEFERIVREIEEVDPDSYCFRYPVNRSGEALLPHHCTVNVVAFAENMDSLLGYLEGAVALLDEAFQATAEARQEVSALFDSDGEF